MDLLKMVDRMRANEPVGSLPQLDRRPGFYRVPDVPAGTRYDLLVLRIPGDVPCCRNQGDLLVARGNQVGDDIRRALVDIAAHDLMEWDQIRLDLKLHEKSGNCTRSIATTRLGVIG